MCKYMVYCDVLFRVMVSDYRHTSTLYMEIVGDTCTYEITITVRHDNHFSLVTECVYGSLRYFEDLNSN